MDKDSKMLVGVFTVLMSLMLYAVYVIEGGEIGANLIIALLISSSLFLLIIADSLSLWHMHYWLYDYLPAVNARYCLTCGKTQSDHMLYERWIDHTFMIGEFKAIFGVEMPSIVKTYMEKEIEE